MNGLQVALRSASPIRLAAEFDCGAGELVALVGPSGSGKTTLVKLLVGLYHPINGHIFYNGHNEQTIDYEELRHQMGLVTQDPQLFSGTIKENLLFVNPNATEEQITGFFRNNLKAQLGNIISWKPDVSDKSNYVMRFENGKLLLKLYVNKDNNIAGMQWLPYKEKIVSTQKSKRASMTDNPLKTEKQRYIDSIASGYLNDTINSGCSIGIIYNNNILS
jgi:ABC-type sugar transport system ATPase subunit